MRILFATSELYPLIKTGGLADVSAALPSSLASMGHSLTVLLPGYLPVLEQAREQGARILADLFIMDYPVTLWATTLPGTEVSVWLVDIPGIFDRQGGPYQDITGRDWEDNAWRFRLFAEVARRLATAESPLGSGRPDIVHCNDWQTGLIPVLLSMTPGSPPTVFTVHNLAYAGLFSRDTFDRLALPGDLWHPDALEFHGRLSLIKGGLVYGDQLTTVSPRYAEEIQQPPMGYGLEGLLRHRGDRLRGIVNGIDERQWDPAHDPYLFMTYDAGRLNGKALCKADLQQTTGLACEPDTPLVGFVGRLVEQKGVDLIEDMIPRLVAAGCQVVLLGSGDRAAEQALASKALQHSSRVAMSLGYDEALAHRITAGADIFLMPSRFEPCGLNQMYSMRYGTLPVVHDVGGLHDTVRDPEFDGLERGTGFVFGSDSAAECWHALTRALALYRQPQHWRRMMFNGMSQDFSWRRSAEQYLDIYRTLHNRTLNKRN